MLFGLLMRPNVIEGPKMKPSAHKVASLHLERNKQASLWDKILRRKPRSWEGTDEEYFQRVMKRRLPERRDLDSGHIQVAKTRLEAVLGRFDRAFSVYRREILEYFENMLIVQQGLEDIANSGRDMTPDELRAEKNLRDSHLNEEQMKSVLEELGKLVNQTQAFRREWGSIF
jgi:hypothetical protein